MKKVLFLDWPCFGHIDACFTLEYEMKYQVVKFFHEDYLERKSDAFMSAFEETWSANGGGFEFCFSFNYYPIMAECCHQKNLKYISLVYDSPFVKLYSTTILYPTNYVFLFDKELYNKFHNDGINTVYYSVLPVNSTVIDTMLKKKYDKYRTTCDVSFVGALYNEQHNIFDRMYAGLDDYTKGYLDGIIKSQLEISGYNFIEEVLKPHIIDAIYKAEPYAPEFDGVETLANVYAEYYVDRKLTSIERINTLTAIAANFPLKLFTLDENAVIPGAKNMGIADYYEEMPYVFHNSKINLNISLRSIKSGIPLRCMDILGAGGFLLTNYQADFFDYFEPDVDFVFYESIDDCLDKIDFYLNHETERAAIAAHGHATAAANHNFKKCFEELLKIAEIR